MAELTPKECLNRFLELLRQTDLAYVKLLRRWNISLNSTWALEYLRQHPEGVEPAVLAETTRMLRQTVTVVLNDLEDRGFIRREFHPTDRRRKLVRLTPEGEAFAAEMLNAIEKVEVGSFAAMTPHERRMLLELAGRFHDSILNASQEA
ncbi:hypothetical protein SDC9_178971 [bioreactor metagenome]|uniref:HTH marR-type domain-containing protein n=1 Tax=bioreactor metagenome TaxID=1076179 RepID=A0A645GXN7_9ZZZZ